MINHDPMYDTDKVCKLYSEKDGVEVNYVCTSAIRQNDNFACDIFYRETPHPEFGNRYFGLFTTSGQLLITNADSIEDLTFEMIYSSIDEQWYYSQHRHDFRGVPGEDVAIDGGRAYTRIVGDATVDQKTMKVKDGKFIDEKGEVNGI